MRRLDEPHRRYHTARHLVEMYWRLRGARARGRDQRPRGGPGPGGRLLPRRGVRPRGGGGRQRGRQRRAGRCGPALSGPRRRTTSSGCAAWSSPRSSTSAPVAEGLAAAFHDADLWILAAPPGRLRRVHAPRCARSMPPCPTTRTPPGGPRSSGRSCDRDTIYATRYGAAHLGRPGPGQPGARDGPAGRPRPDLGLLSPAQDGQDGGDQRPPERAPHTAPRTRPLVTHRQSMTSSAPPPAVRRVGVEPASGRAAGSPPPSGQRPCVTGPSRS